MNDAISTTTFGTEISPKLHQVSNQMKRLAQWFGCLVGVLVVNGLCLLDFAKISLNTKIGLFTVMNDNNSTNNRNETMILGMNIPHVVSFMGCK